MKNAVPWRIEGIDPQTREAAKEAARRAGLSLSDWLNEVIAAEAGPRTARREGGLAGVAKRLESISQHLDEVARRETDTAIPRSRFAREDAGDIVRALDAVARLAELSERRSAAAIEAIERLNPPARSTASAPERSAAEAQLDDIARSIRALDAAAEPAPPRRRLDRDIDSTVAEIAARQRALDAGRAAPAPAPPPQSEAGIGPIAERLDGLTRKLDTLLADLPGRGQTDERAAVAAEIRRLSQRIDAINKPADRGLERELAERLERLGREVQQIAKPADRGLERAIAERLDRLAGQIQEMQRQPAGREAGGERAALLAELKKLSQRVEALGRPDERGVERLVVERLDALGSRLETLLRQPARDSAGESAVAAEIRKLSQRIEALSQPQPDRLGPDLKALAAQIEAVRRDIGARGAAEAEQAVAELRADVAALGRSLGELAPRRAVEALGEEIQALGDRLDDIRARGVSSPALERMLGEFERAIDKLMPAEAVAEELRAISDTLDDMRRSPPGTDAVARVADDIRAVRAMLAETAGREAVDLLADQIAALGSRIDELAAARRDPDAADLLSDRIALIGARLEDLLAEQREDGGVERLAERIDALGARIADMAASGREPAADVERLADRIDALGERIGEIDARPSEAESLAQAIEARIEAIADRMEAATRSLAAAPAPQAMPPALETALRQLADKLEAAQGEAHDPQAIAALERQLIAVAQKIDAADARFGQLGAIERGLSELFGQMEELKAAAARSSAAPAPETAAVADLKREMAHLREAHSASEQRALGSVEAVQQTLERVVRRIAEIEAEAPPARPAPALPPGAKAPPPVDTPVERPAPPPAAQPPARTMPAPRAPTSMDTPLEPGSGPPRTRVPSPGAQAAPGPKADFLAAARRAAQAAVAETAAQATAEPPQKSSLIGRLKGAMRKSAEAPAEPAPAAPKRAAAEPPAPVPPEPGDDAAVPAKPGIGLAERLAANRKTIVMGLAAALLVVAAGLSTLPRLRSAPPAEPAMPAAAPVDPQPAEPRSALQVQEREAGAPAAAAAIAEEAPAPATTGTAGPAAARPAAAPGSSVSPLGWQPAANPAQRQAPIPQGLRVAAEGGNAAAAYELATRHLEGRGTPVNAAEAAKWYQRAADGGLPPAQYRLGSLYEKGTGVPRDYAKARALYERAAEAGNGKAMHNLAVMFAQGVLSERPDYRSAAQWFRRAAEFGVVDSQYNLGILYARGLGVDQSLAESYKWFALSAQNGDQDAAKKRDEVAQRIDAPTLAAARLAVQTFVAKPEPEAAVRVAAPAEGWGDAPAAGAPPAPARRAQAR